MRRPDTPSILRHGIAFDSVAVATRGRILLDPVLLIAAG